MGKGNSNDSFELGDGWIHGEGFSKLYLNREGVGPYVCFIHQISFLSSFFDFNTPIHFFVSDKKVNLSKWGVPNELITRINVPVVHNKIVFEKKENDIPNLVYVLPDGNMDLGLIVSQSIISTINCLLSLRLHIIAPISAIKVLRTIANDNVSFSEYEDDYEKHLSNSDLLLASGELAIKGILNQLPVIIVGDHGFGGLVTDDNLQAFIATDFKGRPGGNLNETIPVSLLIQEIEYVLELNNLKDEHKRTFISQTNIDFLSKLYHIEDHKLKVDSIIKSVNSLFTCLNNEMLYLKLKPIFSDSIVFNEIKRGNDIEYILTNMHTKKVLGAIGYEELELLKRCTGTNTIEDIALLNNKMNSEEHIQFIHELWNERIIAFDFNELPPLN